jgi:hypothetical protein
MQECDLQYALLTTNCLLGCIFMMFGFSIPKSSLKFPVVWASKFTQSWYENGYQLYT